MKSYLIIALKGMMMGIADVIPGVSGGTIAFISGIYNRLVNSLNNVDLQALKLFFTGRWKSLEKKIDGFFLIALVLGILTAGLSFANLVRFLLENYPEAVWSFFFGLVVASSVVVGGHISKWNAANIFSLLIGGGIAFWTTVTSVYQTPHTPFYIFWSGVIAIIAMILPGISGSYILVILEKYHYILGIVSDISIGIKNIIIAIPAWDVAAMSAAWEKMQLSTLFIFWLGTMVGILSFARVLKWLLAKYHDLTVAVLIGFMVGSLNKVWPWKNTLTWYTDSHGKKMPLLEENVLPAVYDGYFFLSVALGIIGYFAVYYIERFAESRQVKIGA